MKKVIALLLVIALTAALSVSLTMAYLNDTDEDVNVMTLGNVYIEQIEQERDAEGSLVPFTQEKPLYPAVYDGTSIPYDAPENWPVQNNSAWMTVDQTSANVIDKFVTVKNTGDSPAYVRTIIAYEGEAINGTDIHIVANGIFSRDEAVKNAFAATEHIENVVIGGVRYDVVVYTYSAALASQETTIPSLKQVYMDSSCGNDEVAKYGDTYDILVLSQAVQTQGFEFDGPTGALDTAFGAPEDTNDETGNMNVVDWFEKILAAEDETTEPEEEYGVFTYTTETSATGETVFVRKQTFSQEDQVYVEVRLESGYFEPLRGTRVDMTDEAGNSYSGRTVGIYSYPCVEIGRDVQPDFSFDVGSLAAGEHVFTFKDANGAEYSFTVTISSATEEPPLEPTSRISFSGEAVPDEHNMLDVGSTAVTIYDESGIPYVTAGDDSEYELVFRSGSSSWMGMDGVVENGVQVPYGEILSDDEDAVSKLKWGIADKGGIVSYGNGLFMIQDQSYIVWESVEYVFFDKDAWTYEQTITHKYDGVDTEFTFMVMNSKTDNTIGVVVTTGTWSNRSIYSTSVETVEEIDWAGVKTSYLMELFPDESWENVTP